MIEVQTRRINVLVTHDVPIVAAGLASILRARPEFNVSSAGETGVHPALAPTRSPIDVMVAGHDDAIRWMRQRAAIGRTASAGPAREEPPRVLLVATSDREADVRQALDAGVHGYVLMGCELAEFVGCVRMLGRGMRYLCPSAARRLAESLTHQGLTSRESDVLQLMVRGCSNKVIARELDIAVGTVKAHVKAVLGKLGVGTRLQAVAAAAERGLGATAGARPPQARATVVGLRAFAEERARADRSGVVGSGLVHPARTASPVH